MRVALVFLLLCGCAMSDQSANLLSAGGDNLKDKSKKGSNPEDKEDSGRYFQVRLPDDGLLLELAFQAEHLGSNCLITSLDACSITTNNKDKEEYHHRTYHRYILANYNMTNYDEVTYTIDSKMTLVRHKDKKGDTKGSDTNDILRHKLHLECSSNTDSYLQSLVFQKVIGRKIADNGWQDEYDEFKASAKDIEIMEREQTECFSKEEPQEQPKPKYPDQEAHQEARPNAMPVEQAAVEEPKAKK